MIRPAAAREVARRIIEAARPDGPPASAIEEAYAGTLVMKAVERDERLQKATGSLSGGTIITWPVPGSGA